LWEIASASVQLQIKLSTVFPAAVFSRADQYSLSRSVQDSDGQCLKSDRALEASMDFARKLDQAQNLSDLFELVKRAVEAVLGRTRAGLMLALADLGNHPQGFLGAFYPVASNVIVMNKVPLLRIQETNPALYKPYAFYVLLHEYLHSLGFIDERVCREQSHRILETLFGVDALVTQISGDTTRFFPNLVFPDAAWQPSELSLEFVRGFDRGSASYIA